MKEDLVLDALLAFAKIELEFAHHHQNQRERMTNIIVVVSGICIAAAGWDKSVNSNDLWLGVFVFILGLYGSLFSLKHYTKFQTHYYRYRAIRLEIDKLYFDGKIMDKVFKYQKKTEENAQYTFIRRVRLHYFWIALPLIMSLIGAAITIQAIFHC